MLNQGVKENTKVCNVVVKKTSLETGWRIKAATYQLS